MGQFLSTLAARPQGTAVGGALVLLGAVIYLQRRAREETERKIKEEVARVRSSFEAQIKIRDIKYEADTKVREIKYNADRQVREAQQALVAKNAEHAVALRALAVDHATRELDTKQALLEAKLELKQSEAEWRLSKSTSHLDGTPVSSPSLVIKDLQLTQLSRSQEEDEQPKKKITTNKKNAERSHKEDHEGEEYLPAALPEGQRHHFFLRWCYQLISRLVLSPSPFLSFSATRRLQGVIRPRC